MSEIINEISKIGIVPVVALDNVEDAAPLAQALIEGGLPCAEVTFRTAAAEESIKIMAKQFPNMLVGAGTVLSTEQADKAVAAGAKFIVSPGLNPKVVKYCVDKNIPVIPGVTNPSDIEIALELGLKVVKFFPAEAAGGLNMIKAMSAPYGGIKFMPTGGISAKNLLSYLDFNKVVACGGSWMVDKEIIKNKDFAKVSALTKEAVQLMLGFEVKHVGINMPDAVQAAETANAFGGMFGFAVKEGNGSFFAGAGVEVMKTHFLGKSGHIAVQTNYIERAVYHLERMGVEFDYSTTKPGPDGKFPSIYMKKEIGGFAVHLLQRK